MSVSGAVVAAEPVTSQVVAPQIPPQVLAPQAPPHVPAPPHSRGPALPPGLAPAFSPPAAALPRGGATRAPAVVSVRLLDSRFTIPEATMQSALDANAKLIKEWTDLIAGRSTLRPSEESLADSVSAEDAISKRVQRNCKVLAALADKLDKATEVSKDDLRSIFPFESLDESFQAVLYTEEYLQRRKAAEMAAIEAELPRTAGTRLEVAMEDGAAVDSPERSRHPQVDAGADSSEAVGAAASGNESTGCSATGTVVVDPGLK